jgi:integrase
MARAYFRRKKGDTSKRQEAPEHGTWWADYTDAQRKRCQVRTPARTKAEAVAYATRMETRAWEVRQGLAPAAPELLTFSEAAARYRKSVEHLPSFRHLDVALSMHVEPALGRKLLTEITPEDVDALAAALRKQLQPSTVKRILIHGSAVFTWAKRRARIFRGDNPFTDATPVEVPRQNPKALTPAQLAAVVAAAGVWRPIFAFAALTGARKGEVCGLLWTDVELDAGLVHVRRSYDAPTTKGRKERSVPIPGPLVEMLRSMKAKATSPYVFPAADGGMRGPNNFNSQQAFSLACVRAGIVAGWRLACPCGHESIAPTKVSAPCPGCSAVVMPRAVPPKLSFKHLRSTYATLLNNPRAAQELLGHSNIRVTVSHYLSAPVEQLRHEVDRLPAAEILGKSK